MAELAVRSAAAKLVAIRAELIFAIAIFWMFIFPVGTYGNVGSYLNILCVTLLIVARYGFSWRGQWGLPLVVMALLLAEEVLSIGVGWHTREYVLPLLWVILLVRLPKLDGYVVVRVLLALFAVLILVDFVILYLGFFGALGSKIRELVYMRSLRQYIEHFWRHIGIIGNPNGSAFLYGIYLVVLSFAISRSQFALNRIEKFLLLSVGPVAVFLLTETYSRTNLIAVALVACYALIQGGAGRWRYLFVIGVVGVLLFSFGGYERIELRFETLSSGEKRLLHWDALLGGMTFDDVVMGAPLTAGFTDSDYLFVLLRFGVVGSVAILWVLVSLYASARKQGLLGELFSQLMAYGAISGVAMGVFVMPNTGAFLLYLGAVVLSSRDRGDRLASSANARRGIVLTKLAKAR